MPLFRPQRAKRRKKKPPAKTAPVYAYNSESYKKWRQRVFRRDHFACQICHQKSSKGHKVPLEAHHILRKADFPQLMLTVSNGITLCADCHRVITGNEYFWAKQLLEIVKTKGRRPKPPL